MQLRSDGGWSSSAIISTDVFSSKKKIFTIRHSTTSHSEPSVPKEKPWKSLYKVFLLFLLPQFENLLQQLKWFLMILSPHLHTVSTLYYPFILSHSLFLFLLYALSFTAITLSTASVLFSSTETEDALSLHYSLPHTLLSSQSFFFKTSSSFMHTQSLRQNIHPFMSESSMFILNKPLLRLL